MSTGFRNNPVDRRLRRRQAEDYHQRVRSDINSRNYRCFFIYNSLSSTFIIVSDYESLCPLHVSSAVRESLEETVGSIMGISPNISIDQIILTLHSVTKFF